MKEILTFGTTRINLEDITLSKTNQTHDKYHDSTQMSSQIQKTKQNGGCQEVSGGRKEDCAEWKLCLMGRRKFCRGTVAQLCGCTHNVMKLYNPKLVKMVNSVMYM